MRRGYGLTDLKILEALAVYGPRNLAEVSRKTGIHPETLRKKINRLSSQFFLRFNINVNYARLGLKRAIVFAEAVPGYEDILFDALKVNDFWIFVGRCYGMFEGCVGIFVVPWEFSSLFEQYIDELKKLGLSIRTQIFWLTHIHSINSRCKWFDEKRAAWNFNWDEWMKEVETGKGDASQVLLESEPLMANVDETDILILKELEIDARISFTKLGERLGISPQLVRYHYYRHVIGEELLKSFEVTFLHFGKDSEFSFFIFSFDKEINMAKFACSLMDKPFVKALGKILGKNQLYGYLYFPRNEFRKFLQVLSKLVRKKLLRSYQYAIQDLTNSSRATIPFQCFKNGRWIYNHERYLKILNKFVKKEIVEKPPAIQSL